MNTDAFYPCNPCNPWLKNLRSVRAISTIAVQRRNCSQLASKLDHCSAKKWPRFLSSLRSLRSLRLTQFPSSRLFQEFEKPSLLLVEEPEIHLHPTALRRGETFVPTAIKAILVPPNESLSAR
jgi:predicted ATP-dependent endonuclease of OLD family